MHTAYTLQNMFAQIRNNQQAVHIIVDVGARYGVYSSVLKTAADDQFPNTDIHYMPIRPGDLPYDVIYHNANADTYHG